MFQTPASVFKGATPNAQQVQTRAAPVGGINARDAIAVMPDSDAVSMVNWIPDSLGVRCRKGFREWSTNLGDAVGSIIHWMGRDSILPGGTFLTTPSTMPGKLFAATNAGIYDITDAGASPVEVFTLSGGDRSGWMSHSMVNNIAGSFLAVSSETDGYLLFDGTAWSSVVEGTSPGQVEGVDPGRLVFVASWKNRLWFVERDTTVAWYLPTDAITGKAEAFDFGSVFSQGGQLAYLGNWTLDAGEGIDDFLVAVSTVGDVAVYKGSDPTSVQTFGLVGVFNVGVIPVGRRGFCQLGGDLVILSANGVFPMSYITRGGSGLLQASDEEYSSYIRSPLGQDMQASFTDYGWQIFVHPAERLLLINVPDYGGRRSRQYAMSTVKNRWTTLEGIPSTCYGRCFNYVFGGTADGRVLLLFNGFFDDVKLGESVGNGIVGSVQPAFSYFGSPSLSKQFLMVRPSFLAIDEPAYSVTMQTNFNTMAPVGSPYSTATNSYTWDTAEWDDAKWGGNLINYSAWRNAVGVGSSGSAGLVTTCVGDTILVSLDYMFQQGGPL